MVAATALAGAAQAQGAPHGAADEIAARSGVGDLFRNVTSGPEPRLRHSASGMVCGFGEDDGEWRRDDVSVFQSGLPRGDDVGCNIWRGHVLTSMDVTRWPTPPSLDTEMPAFERSVIAMHPQARIYSGPFPPFTPPVSLPAWRTVRYVFDDKGAQYSRLSVAVAKGWVVEERVTGPIAEAQAADALANAELVAALSSLR